MVELELLAVVYAANKTRLLTLGRRTELVTDHQPLVSILNDKSFDQISNPRVFRLKEKLLPFNFVAVWKKGSDNVIPDALSRAPVDLPDEDDADLEKELAEATCALVSINVLSLIHI